MALGIKITTINYEEDFWKIYPSFRLIEEFDQMYKEDKKRSSIIMWSMLAYGHPTSPLYNMSDKKQRINDKLNQYEAEVTVEGLQEQGLLDLMIDACTTEAMKALISWDENMKRRREFLRGEYNTEMSNLKIMEMMEKMSANNKKLYDDYFDISKRLKEDMAGNADEAAPHKKSDF